jgi:hypothetical protein
MMSTIHHEFVRINKKESNKNYNVNYAFNSNEIVKNHV